MESSEFLRLFPMRVPNLMWFLGAGASVAARVPSAGHLILDFKRTLYCAANKIHVRTCPDLGDPALLARFRAYFTTARGFPPENSEDEYAALFQLTYQDEKDRRRYIETFVKGAVPSFGHMALAALAKVDKIRVIWTTNFDRAPEDAIAKVFGTTANLIVAALKTPELAVQALNEGRFPLVAKIHGDFQSRELKNTSPELIVQDQTMRRAMVDACRRFGLAVVGYSGRDNSVMDALEEALDNGHGFPAGLFWFHRPGSPPFKRAVDLIDKARALKVDAHLVEAESFDELMADLLLLINDLPPDLLELLDARPRRLTPASIPSPGAGMPFVRFNALPIVVSPKTCRRIECKIGGAKEVFDAVAKSGANIVVGRRQVGVLAFGSDSEVRKAFEPFEIGQFDLWTIESNRLDFDSAERGLLVDALCRAIVRDAPLKAQRMGSDWKLYVDDTKAADAALATLRTAVGVMTGKVANTGVHWAEAIRIRIEQRLDRLWLLFEPAIWIDDRGSDSDEAIVKEFIRGRLAARYNVAVNKVYDGWANLITRSAGEAELRAFGIGDGVDAVFRICNTTGFSKRVVRS